MLSVVIPYRDVGNSHRRRIAHWVFLRYKKLLPGAEVVLGQDTSGGQYFRRSLAINNGVKRTHGEYILIADADAIFFPDAIMEGVSVLQNTDWAWVLPYGIYHMLNRESSGKILQLEPSDDPTGIAVPEASFPDSTASLAIVRKDEYIPFDERYIAWGPEDQSWALAMDTLCGRAKRLYSHDMLHLWHPINPKTRTENPHYKTSLKLWERYKRAAGNPEMMTQLLKESVCA